MKVPICIMYYTNYVAEKPIHIHLAYTIKHIKNILDFFLVLIKLTQNFA